MDARDHQCVLSRRAAERLSRRVVVVSYLMCTGLFAGSAFGQAPKDGAAPEAKPPANLQEEVRLLRSEVQELRAEVNDLRQLVRSNQGPAPSQSVSGSTAPVTEPAPGGATASTQSASAGTAPQSPAATPSELSVVQSQIAEMAQTKVESNSKMPVKIYGTILSTTFFNSRAVDWADEPVRVLLPSEGGPRTGTFSSSLRQSRIGVLVDGPTIGSFKTTGVFAIDFNGGQTDFTTSPTFGLADIVYGYVRLENSRTAIEVGQDEMILAPRNPTSLVALAYPDLYRAGNLYVRVPQVRLEQKLVNGNRGVLKLTAGLVAPIGTYENVNTTAAGWQRPAGQARLSWQSASIAAGNDSGVELGVSGHYGRIGLGGFSVASWAGSFDFNARHDKLGFDGEGFFGQNLQGLGGGIGQPGKTMGGYLEGRFLPTNRLQFNGGFGTDHLTKLDVISVPLQRNSAMFANTIYQFTPELDLSLEYRYMFTKPFNGLVRSNNNLVLGIAFNF